MSVSPFSTEYAPMFADAYPNGVQCRRPTSEKASWTPGDTTKFTCHYRITGMIE